VNADRRATLAAAALAALAAGCFSPRSITCTDGMICPVGTSCDVINHTCTTDQQCVGNSEGAGCKVGQVSQFNGQCHAGMCQLFHCGDGIRNNGEACDGADLGGQTCVSLHFYGQTPGTTGLTCNSQCSLDTRGCFGYCGDGIVNGPEECDGAPTSSPVLCSQFGYDRGVVGCTASCKRTFANCTRWSGWTVAEIPEVASDLRSVWGSGPNDVYAVGGPTVLHWNGTEWSATTRAIAGNPDLNLLAVWGSGPADVYAGGGSRMFHWNGQRWDMHDFSSPVGPILDIWGSGPSDVYAVGGLHIEHWDGTSWSELEPGTFQSIWGSGPSDVWAVGGRDAPGTVHWDGTAWSPVTLAVDGGRGTRTRVWGRGPNDVYFAGGAVGIDHWDGASWSTLDPGSALDIAALWGTGSRDLVALSTDGTLATWDGDRWTLTSPVQTGQYFYDLWGGGGSLFGVGTSIFTHGPTSWGTLPFSGTAPSLNGVWGSGSGDLFAVGDAGALAHWDGSAWTTTALDPGVAMRSVWGSGPGDVLAVGDNRADDPTGVLAHWDGVAWSHPSLAPTVPLPGALRGVWGSGANNIYVVGTAEQRGATFRWDGASWTEVENVFPYVMPPPGGPSGPPTDPHGPPLVGVWGSGPNDLFVASTGGISHWDGRAWSASGFGGGIGITGIWGSGPSDVYAVDLSGLAAHWDGTAWRTMVWNYKPLRAVGGTGPGDVWVAGDDVLYHSSGPAPSLRDMKPIVYDWEPIALPVSGSIHGLWVTPSRVVMVGTMGEIHLDRGSVTCVGPEQSCNDGWDNDCDGLADTADPDCAGQVSEQCADGVDNDGDGKIDCTDRDCATFPGCDRL
jgi:hypothetical protein